MNTITHNNGWTITIKEDIKNLTLEQLYEVAKLCNKHYVVVFKNQNLTIEDQQKITSSIGEVKWHHGDNEAETERILIAPGIIRVTGELNEKGEQGLFGHEEELKWHTHHVHDKNIHRFPYVWLYSVKGSKGSKTSWINQEMAYNDLTLEMKEKLDKIVYATGGSTDQFSKMLLDSTKFPVDFDRPTKLVHTNIEGKKGLFFPFNQVHSVFEGVTQKEWEELKTFLIDHCTQEKYIYHHNWEDNDLVISEQWLSIHKRWSFDGMKERLLHRIAFDYNNVYNLKPYYSIASKDF